MHSSHTNRLNLLDSECTFLDFSTKVATFKSGLKNVYSKYNLLEVGSIGQLTTILVTDRRGHNSKLPALTLYASQTHHGQCYSNMLVYIFELAFKL